MPANQVTLKIPRGLYDRLNEIIASTGFRSVTEFAVYVLRDLASTHAARSTIPGQAPPGAAEAPRQAPAPEQPLTAEEIEAIRRRLRALGYL